jgi:hypothetical protein
MIRLLLLASCMTFAGVTLARSGRVAPGILFRVWLGLMYGLAHHGSK